MIFSLLSLVEETLNGEKKWIGKKSMIPAGLELAISWFVVRRLIHWATGPSDKRCSKIVLIHSFHWWHTRVVVNMFIYSNVKPNHWLFKLYSVIISLFKEKQPKLRRLFCYEAVLLCHVTGSCIFREVRSTVDSDCYSFIFSFIKENIGFQREVGGSQSYY